MALKLIITDDGSHTLNDDTLNEIYHSTTGAVQESLHVYIRSGYNAIRHKFDALNILEIGFGTGLNAWLTLLECQKENKTIRYISLEPFPIPHEIYTKLNFTDHNQSCGNKENFLKLHTSEW